MREEQVPKKKGLHQRQKRLRRLAVQIVSQLPEDVAEAGYVLDFAKNLVRFVDSDGKAVPIRGPLRAA